MPRPKTLPMIIARIIPHKEQRYATIGDYLNGNGLRQYRISKMGNADYEFLVLIHELVEHHLCEKRGIKEQDITAFDLAFEVNRKPGNTDEPGFAADAPYRTEHKFATDIEFKIATEMGIDWQKYCTFIENFGVGGASARIQSRTRRNGGRTADRNGAERKRGQARAR